MKCLLTIIIILVSVKIFALEIDTVLPGRNAKFWNAVEKGIQDSGKKLSVNVKVRGPSDEITTTKNQEMQKTMIDTFIQSGAEAIILAPAPLTLTPKTKIRFNVPLILLDRPSEDYDALTLVATNNEEAGKNAFNCIAQYLSSKSIVAVFRLDPNITSTNLREKGFIERAKSKKVKITIDKVIGANFREAADNAYNAIMSSNTQIDLVFTPNEVTAFGALKAIERVPADKRPKYLIGFDYRDEFHAAILRDKMLATIVQDAYEMGSLALEEAFKIIKGNRPPPFIGIPTFCVTKENINSAEIVNKLQQYK